MENETVGLGFEIAKWLESTAGIVATFSMVVNAVQMALGIYRDRRHKQICIELGEAWIKEVEKWALRIDQMREDTRRAFESVQEISLDGSDAREKIAVGLAQMAEAQRSLTHRIDSMAADIRAVMTTRNGR